MRQKTLPLQESKSERNSISPNLIKGFVLAFLFHILFLALFHIISPTPLEEGIPLTPSTVEIDLKTETPPFQAPLPQLALDPSPAHYELPLTGGICSIERQSAFNCQEPDFSSLERFDYIPLEVDFDHD